MKEREAEDASAVVTMAEAAAVEMGAWEAARQVEASAEAEMTVASAVDH